MWTFADTLKVKSWEYLKNILKVEDDSYTLKKVEIKKQNLPLMLGAVELLAPLFGAVFLLPFCIFFD